MPAGPGSQASAHGSQPRYWLPHHGQGEPLGGQEGGVPMNGSVPWWEEAGQLAFSLRHWRITESEPARGETSAEPAPGSQTSSLHSREGKMSGVQKPL